MVHPRVRIVTFFLNFVVFAVLVEVLSLLDPHCPKTKAKHQILGFYAFDGVKLVLHRVEQRMEGYRHLATLQSAIEHERWDRLALESAR
jgi:predicted transcriptional regulator